MISVSDKTRLYFYDHRPGKYNRERQAGCVALLNVTRLIREVGVSRLIVNAKEDATHLIIHLNDFDRNRKARSGEWPDSARTDQIILCLTSVNRFDPVEFPHLITQANGFQRVTFFCRDTEPLRHVDTFAAFCNLAVEDAKRIADGEVSPLDANLRRLFVDISDRYLSALTILCQAYLVLYASTAPSLARGSTEINQSLEEMGLWVTPGKFGEIPLPADPQETLNSMTSPWWAAALTGNEFGQMGEESLSVANRIRMEWEGLVGAGPKDTSRSEYTWADVETLTGAIGLNVGQDGRPLSGGARKFDPVIVARAYLAIRGMLAARN
jgi:hypothetical protein